jgi:hypothetical protein
MPMLMMDDARLAEITGQLAPADADELIAEVAYLRRQHETDERQHDRDVRLLRRCRDELIRVNDAYQDLLARAEAWAEQERAGLDPSALIAQDQAEEPDPEDTE